VVGGRKGRQGVESGGTVECRAFDVREGTVDAAFFGVGDCAGQ